jgi:phospholipid/cholesterol/gamma-HCH transport system substrate-binding protein
MAKDDMMKQFWAGVFFILGMTLIGGAVFFIGFQKGMTQPYFLLSVLFDKVGGLTEGAPVRLSGVNVGTVEAIDFLDKEIMERGVKVTLRIQKRYEKPVSRSTRISLQTEGVLGAKYIEIGREPGESALDLSRQVLGKPMLDVYDLAEVLQDTAGSFNDTTRGINTMVTQLNYISRKTKRLLDRAEQRMIDGNLFKVF